MHSYKSREGASLLNLVLVLLLIIPSDYNIIQIILGYLAASPHASQSFIKMIPFLEFALPVVVGLIFVPLVLGPMFPVSMGERVVRFSKRRY